MVSTKSTKLLVIYGWWWLLMIMNDTGVFNNHHQQYHTSITIIQVPSIFQCIHGWCWWWWWLLLSRLLVRVRPSGGRHHRSALSNPCEARDDLCIGADFRLPSAKKHQKATTKIKWEIYAVIEDAICFCEASDGVWTSAGIALHLGNLVKHMNRCENRCENRCVSISFFTLPTGMFSEIDQVVRDCAMTPKRQLIDMYWEIRP